MNIEIHNRKGPYLLNMVLGGIGFYFSASTLVLQIKNAPMGVWFTLLLAIALVVSCVVLYKAKVKLSNKVPALVFTDEGIIDHASPLKAGLIRWEEIVACKLERYDGYNQLMLTLEDNSRIENQVGAKQKVYLLALLGQSMRD